MRKDRDEYGLFGYGLISILILIVIGCLIILSKL
jgi:hypothetical protein